MPTRKAIVTTIQALCRELRAWGYEPQRAVLFGSYAKGHPHPHSDIDVAIWDSRFSGCGTEDITPIASLISRYPRIELHTFGVDDTPEKNPFAAEVMRHGILIDLP